MNFKKICYNSNNNNGKNMNPELLKELAELNEKSQEIKYEENTSPLKDFNHISLRENGITDSLEQIKKASKKLLSKEDLEKIKNPEDVFDILINKVEEKLNKESSLNKDLLNMRIRRIELIDQLLTESKVNPNLNFVKIREFSSNHKAIEAFQALEKIYPEKFKFETIQQMNVEGTQNSLNFLIHGDLEELKEVIKTTPELRFLKSIANKSFNDYFENHKERGIIFEGNKLLKLTEIDSEDVDLLLKNKKSRTNKI